MIGAFEKELEKKAGKDARYAFEEFKSKILGERGLSEASAYIPPLALRGDIAAGASLSPYFIKLLQIVPKGTLLTGPFSNIMDQFKVRRSVVHVSTFHFFQLRLTNLLLRFIRGTK